MLYNIAETYNKYLVDTNIELAVDSNIKLFSLLTALLDSMTDILTNQPILFPGTVFAS